MIDPAAHLLFSIHTQTHLYYLGADWAVFASGEQAQSRWKGCHPCLHVPQGGVGC